MPVVINCPGVKWESPVKKARAASWSPFNANTAQVRRQIGACELWRARTRIVPSRRHLRPALSPSEMEKSVAGMNQLWHGVAPARKTNSRSRAWSLDLALLRPRVCKAVNAVPHFRALDVTCSTPSKKERDKKCVFFYGYLFLWKFFIEIAVQHFFI